MKCSISVAPKFTAKGHLVLGKANVWLEVKDLDGCMVVPYTLMATKDNSGKFKAPFVVSGQPTYMDKSNKRKVSYQNIHMDGTLAQQLDALVDLNWFKNEVKRLKGTPGTAADHILDKKSGTWKHEADRVYTSVMGGEDEDLLSDMVSMADEFAKKAEASTGTTSGTAQNDATVESVLGAVK
jgi:hypothetical protein